MNHNLLLIDDDNSYKEVLHVRLEAVGCHVKMPASLAELKDLLSQKWGLIVSDSQFQGLSSEGLLALLKPMENVVFFYTEKTAQELTTSWKEQGIREVFPKLRRGELIRAIQSWTQSHVSTGEGTAPVAPSPRSKKFLLVDDSPTIRKFVRTILSRSFPGSEVFEAEDGKTAMHELSGQRMDLIVTDMQMPGVDGQSFIKTLQRNSLLNKKPIIILSGMVTKEMEKEYGVIPTIRILSKPADPGTITETIKSLLKS